MKMRFVSLLTCGLFVVGSVFGDQPTKPVDLELLDQQLATAQADLDTKIPGATAFADIRITIKGWNELTDARRKRLLAACDDLEARARNRQIEVMDVIMLRRRAIDARLEAYMDELISDAKDRKPTRELFGKVCDLLEKRAALATTPPDLRAKLDECMAVFFKRYKDASQPTGFEACTFGDEIVLESMDRAIAWLGAKARERKATREQFQHVIALLERRGELWHDDLDFRNHVARMKLNIEQMMEKGVKEGLTEDEIRTLHTECMKRARGAIQ